MGPAAGLENDVVQGHGVLHLRPAVAVKDELDGGWRRDWNSGRRYAPLVIDDGREGRETQEDRLDLIDDQVDLQVAALDEL